MSVGVGYALLGSVVNPLGFQIGGDVSLTSVPLTKAPITPKIPVLLIVNQFSNLYQQD
jgi:hypothetical protein